jgi:antitoxin component of MazEF toxin-antitoxin module
MNVSRIIRQGNSAAVILPKRLLEALSWRVGTHVVVEPIESCIVIRLAPECAPLTDSKEVRVNGKMGIPPRGRTFAR